MNGGGIAFEFLVATQADEPTFAGLSESGLTWELHQEPAQSAHEQGEGDNLGALVSPAVIDEIDSRGLAAGHSVSSTAVLLRDRELLRPIERHWRPEAGASPRARLRTTSRFTATPFSALRTSCASGR